MPGHLSRGGGAGIDGKKSGMWREMARIIGEVRPKYAFVENSPMLTSRGLGTVLRDLAEMGYDAEWGVLGAADIGANHQRDRIWIIAKQRDILSYTKHNGIGWGEQQSESTQETNGRHSIGELADTDLCRHIHGQTEINTTIGKFDALGEFRSSCSKIPNTSSENVERHELPCRTPKGFFAFGSHSWWSIEPNLDRVAHGVASRVDRLKAIGNGQVPLCAATAWTILMERINES